MRSAAQAVVVTRVALFGTRGRMANRRPPPSARSHCLTQPRTDDPRPSPYCPDGVSQSETQGRGENKEVMAVVDDSTRGQACTTLRGSEEASTHRVF